MAGEVIPFYDLHSHFLPGMDDGAETPEMSLLMLSKMREQGCRGVVSTSHYYAHESINQFLSRREAAYGRLMDEAEKQGVVLPEIEFGAEVAYNRGLVYNDDLEKLCFGKSNFLLLEMPFSRWSPEVMRNVRQIAAGKGIRLIIAHIERFLKIGTKDQIEELLYSDALIQVNAENFESFSGRRTVVKLIKSGFVQLICSDSHNVGIRRPNMDMAIAYLRKAGMEDELFEILANNRAVFKAAAGL